MKNKKYTRKLKKKNKNRSFKNINKSYEIKQDVFGKRVFIPLIWKQVIESVYKLNRGSDLNIKYNIRNIISKSSDNKKDENKYDLITESVEIFNSEMKRLKLLNKKFFIFYTPSKGNRILNNFIYSKIYEGIDFEIIDLSNDILDNMLEDEVHYNKQGHNAVSNIMLKRILKDLK